MRQRSAPCPMLASKGRYARNAEPLENRRQEFAEYLQNEAEEEYAQPLVAAVSALPRQDLSIGPSRIFS